MTYIATHEFIHAIGHYQRGEVIRRTTGTVIKSLLSKSLIEEQKEPVSEVKKALKKAKK